MIRVRTVLTGWTGGPGLQTFYFSPISALPSQAEINDVAARVRAFWSAAAFFLASPVLVNVNPAVDFIDPSTGLLTGSGAATPAPGPVSGTAVGEFYAPGMCANLTFETGVTQSGRRVRGRSYIGPTTEGVVAVGQLTVGSTVPLVTAVGPMLVAGATPSKLLVWSRPKPGRPGGAFSVTSAFVPLKLAHLKSRRD